MKGQLVVEAEKSGGEGGFGDLAREAVLLVRIVTVAVPVYFFTASLSAEL